MWLSQTSFKILFSKKLFNVLSLKSIISPYSSYSENFSKIYAGLPDTQGTQGNSGNFKVEENLRETQGDSEQIREFSKYRKSKGDLGKLKI